jgi:ring-1,2-phenylacetyl-CoA epoxidase subunit PaaC
MTDKTKQTADWHIESLLRLGDDALILGQRVGQWCGHGPALEEDLAMANVGLDLIGQARMLYTHAGELEGLGHDEDWFAYFRDAGQFRNHSLMELPNGQGKHDDYAITIARNWIHSARMVALWTDLADSSDTQLAAIAAKAVKESVSHLRHSRDWVIRFGDGTELSHQKIQSALDQLWPYTNELFTDDDTDRASANASVTVLPSSLRERWQQEINNTLAQATLTEPAKNEYLSTGKQGVHTEHLDYVLVELQSVARAHPGATW